MSCKLLLDLSRRISELEQDVRLLRYPSGVLDALNAAQTAIARQLARDEQAEREGRVR